MPASCSRSGSTSIARRPIRSRRRRPGRAPGKPAIRGNAPESHERITTMNRVVLAATMAVTVAGVWSVAAQRGPGGNAVRQFVKVDAPVVAITHVRVIDGTGAPAREDQTLIIRAGNIAALGPAATVAVPEGATVVDGTGKSVMPGLVMVHEHLYYPTGPQVY